MGLIEQINSAVNGFIWGVPAMAAILGVGLILSIRTHFIQIRKFGYAMKVTFGRMFRKRDAQDGALTPFQAVCTALAATIGTGNIAGVAGAIAIGGPGAVFWMWIGDAGRPLSGEEQEGRAGRRPDVLHQERSGKTLDLAGVYFRRLRCPDRLRNRKCNPGQYDHDGY